MANEFDVIFPVRRTVVTMGAEEPKALYKGDIVKCPRCGQNFEANSKTAFKVGDEIYLNCPKIIRTETDDFGKSKEIRCNYKFNALYAVHREVDKYEDGED